VSAAGFRGARSIPGGARHRRERGERCRRFRLCRRPEGLPVPPCRHPEGCRRRRPRSAAPASAVARWGVGVVGRRGAAAPAGVSAGGGTGAAAPAGAVGQRGCRSRRAATRRGIGGATRRGVSPAHGPKGRMKGPPAVSFVQSDKPAAPAVA
jgi:hypothetical protein